jgi:hypothetical protein
MIAVGVIMVEDYSESSSGGMAVFNSLREGEYVVTLQEERHGITFVSAAETGLAAQLCIVQCVDAPPHGKHPVTVDDAGGVQVGDLVLSVTHTTGSRGRKKVMRPVEFLVERGAGSGGKHIRTTSNTYPCTVIMVRKAQLAIESLHRAAREAEDNGQVVPPNVGGKKKRRKLDAVEDGV